MVENGSMPIRSWRFSTYSLWDFSLWLNHYIMLRSLFGMLLVLLLLLPWPYRVYFAISALIRWHYRLAFPISSRTESKYRAVHLNDTTMSSKKEKEKENKKYKLKWLTFNLSGRHDTALSSSEHFCVNHK